MSFTVTQLKSHLIGMGHSGTLGKVRQDRAMFERSASKFLLKCHPIESMRTAPLAAAVHDDLNNYALASDFGSLIDLYPEGDRQLWDRSFRDRAGRFDREKAIRNRTISIEGSEGTKIIRINWKARAAKVLNAMNSLTANGTWAIVGTASSLVLDTITKFSGSGALRFNVAATGDGIQCSDMAQVDLSDENGVGDVIFPIYLGSDYANLTSITPIWGNALSGLNPKYWTGSAITAQADGTAFKQGWNVVKAAWSSAVQTGTVDPATIDCFKVTLTVTGAMSNIRIDNILFSIGRAFDHKYYSKYLFKSASTGAWISQPTSDDDYVMIDNDTLPLFLFELLTDMAHQMEGTDSAFDMNFAQAQLKELFPYYRGLYPSQVKKVRGQSSSGPRLRRYGR